MENALNRPIKLAYSVQEVAEQTSLSKAFVRNEIRSGKLKAKKVGGRVLVLSSELNDYLAGNEDWVPSGADQGIKN